MKFLLPIILLSFLVFTSCEDDPLPVYPDEIVISCQEDADAAKLLIGDAVFDEDEPEAGYRGDIVITNPTGSCTSPLTDLSLFAKHKFWLGAIEIESDAISDLSFLSHIEQIRRGLSIINCNNLDSIDLPKTAFIGDFFFVVENPKLGSMSIGTELTDTYKYIELDSTIITSNPSLSRWDPGTYYIDFIKSAIISDNVQLTSLLALENLSFPSRTLELDLYGTTIDADGINDNIDSLVLPQRTIINAIAPNNDYSWLSKTKGRDRIGDEGIKTDSVVYFRLRGDITIPEVCSMVGIFDSTTMLSIISTNLDVNGEITEELLLDECP